MKKHLTILMTIILLLLVSVAWAETEAKTDADKSKSDVKTEKVENESVIEKTLEKIPAIKEDAQKEEITTQPAAVTRANKQSREKLPLIWKLDREQASPQAAPAENEVSPAETE